MRMREREPGLGVSMPSVLALSRLEFSVMPGGMVVCGGDCLGSPEMGLLG